MDKDHQSMEICYNASTFLNIVSNIGPLCIRDPFGVPSCTRELMGLAIYAGGQYTGTMIT